MMSNVLCVCAINEIMELITIKERCSGTCELKLLPLTYEIYM